MTIEEKWPMPPFAGGAQIPGVPKWDDALIKEALEGPEPEPLRQTIPLPGQVGEIVGSPWGGKTWVALQLAVSIACGRDLLDIGMTGADAGPVTYVRLQDVRDVVKFRMRHIIQELGDGPAVASLRTAEVSPIRIVDGVGSKMVVDRLGKIDLDAIKELEAICRGRRLVILDPLARICPDIEDPAMVSQTLAILEQVAQRTGTAIIVCRNYAPAIDDKHLLTWRWALNRLTSTPHFPEVIAKRPMKIQASGAYRGTRADGAVLPEREYVRDEYGMLRKMDNETRVLLKVR